MLFVDIIALALFKISKTFVDRVVNFCGFLVTHARENIYTVTHNFFVLSSAATL